MPPAYEVLLLNTAIPQIQAAQSGDTYVVPRDIAFSAALTLSAGTANGVPYLNGSKVLTSGSALTFDGTRLGIGSTANTEGMLTVGTGTVTDKNGIVLYRGAASSVSATQVALFNELNGISNGESLTLRSPAGYKFQNNDGASEWMRLTSTGLGIGTASPSQKLQVAGAIAATGQAPALTASSTFFDYVSTNIGRFAVVGNTTGATPPIVFSQYSSNGSIGRDAVTIDASGNLGLGVTPSAWDAVFRAIDVGQASNGISGNSGTTQLTQAAYYNSGWKYGVSSTAAARYELNVGVHSWHVAPSGTAGNAITFTQALTLDGIDGSGYGKNLKLGGTADRATTKGTHHFDIFDGTAPVGTLANGISLYSSSGEAYVMDAAGNATLFSPHDSETNEWIFRSKHTPTGKVLKIDVEKMLRFINDHFGLNAIHEFTE